MCGEKKFVFWNWIFPGNDERDETDDDATFTDGCV